jgi:hypothetical protein
VALLASPWACGSILGIPNADDPESGVAGEGGAAGQAGEMSSGGASRGGRGGSAGRGGTAGTTSSGGSSAGKAAAGGGPPGGMGAGAAGAGGEDPSGPRLGEPCEGEALVCNEGSSRVVLSCADGVWAIEKICLSTELCVSGECDGFVGECTRQGAWCLEAGELMDCEDPFVPQRRKCPWGCSDGACVPGTGDQLIVHTEVNYVQSAPPWPDGEVPICFETFDADDAALREFIESEVRRTWGRYYDIRFFGFDVCTGAAEGQVRIEFLDGCEGRLAGNAPLGYPGELAPSRVGICRSYVDAQGESRRLEAEEAVARYLVRHQFGHVLFFFEDDPPLSHPWSVMARGFDASRADELVIGSDELLRMRNWYWPKPSGSVVAMTGSCLRPAGNTVEVAPCERDEAQRFRFEPQRFVARNESSCLEVASSGSSPAVELGACPPSPTPNSVSLRRARWSTPDRCVMPRTLPASTGTALVTSDCLPVGDPVQTWALDVLADAGDHVEVRIRHIASALCVQEPPGLTAGLELPTLETCTSTTTVFSVWSSGAISSEDQGSASRQCLRWQSNDSLLTYGSCGVVRGWFFSGPIESSEGFALRVTSEAPSAEVVAEPLGPSELPRLDQVFDVHF